VQYKNIVHTNIYWTFLFSSSGSIIRTCTVCVDKIKWAALFDHQRTVLMTENDVIWTVCEP